MEVDPWAGSHQHPSPSIWRIQFFAFSHAMLLLSRFPSHSIMRQKRKKKPSADIRFTPFSLHHCYSLNFAQGDMRQSLPSQNYHHHHHQRHRCCQRNAIMPQFRFSPDWWMQTAEVYLWWTHCTLHSHGENTYIPIHGRRITKLTHNKRFGDLFEWLYISKR